MDILSNESNTHIISWLPHGNGFVIHKKKTFASEVLPRYFKASKFTSFTRKLNRWGFSRIPRGPETGSYYHKLFRRDNPELVLQMSSNSGNKQQHSMPMSQHNLLPNLPGMGMGAGPGQAMFPYNPAAGPAMPSMMPNLTPQQQQAMWQQQMQQMLQFQQMMQMQQQQQFASPQQQQNPQQQQGPMGGMMMMNPGMPMQQQQFHHTPVVGGMQQQHHMPGMGHSASGGGGNDGDNGNGNDESQDQQHQLPSPPAEANASV